MRVDSFTICVSCLKESFTSRRRVEIRSTMTSIGKIAHPVCDSMCVQSNECSNCIMNLRRIFMDENYMHDPSLDLNPFTMERYPLPKGWKP